MMTVVCTSTCRGGLFISVACAVLHSLSVIAMEAQFLPVLTPSQSQAPSLWWIMARLVNLKTGNIEQFPGCSSIPFSRAQRRYCETDSSSHSLMRVLARASLATAFECERQFQESKWNCSRYEKGPLFGRSILQLATKEAAFVHALMSASVTHETALACSRGQLSSFCGCAPLPNNVSRFTVPINTTAKSGFQWGSCHDNIDYGSRFARDFTSHTTLSNWNDHRHLLNKHNTNVGILRVKDNMHIRCKCHGLSGACSVQVCWHALPNFRKVGNILYASFQTAIPAVLTTAHPSKSAAQDAASSLTVKSSTVGPASSDVTRSLLYGEPSLGYCDQRKELDILGPRGRECRPSSNEQDGCESLCCTRGFNNMITKVRVKCKCRFIWCCRVECDHCDQIVKTSLCK